MLLLFDLDGTLISPKSDPPLPLPAVRDTLSRLSAEHRICLVTNQAAAALGILTDAQVNDWLSRCLHAVGLPDTTEIYAARHHPEAVTAELADPVLLRRRKPSPALLFQAMFENQAAARDGILYVGDQLKDQAAARAANVSFCTPERFFASPQVAIDEARNASTPESSPSVLIEGADCAGKTTLAKELKNRLGYDLICASHRPGDQFARYGHLYSTLSSAVFERGHISEIVYSRLYGRPAPFTAQERRLLDGFISEQMIVIHADPEPELARIRYADREHVYQSTGLDELNRCIELFSEELALTSPARVIRYRSHDHAELEQLLSQLEELLGGSKFRPGAGA